MVTKNLTPSESSSSYEYSSSEEDEDTSAPSASVVAAAAVETKVSSEEVEEEEDSGEDSSEEVEDEASSEEDEPSAAPSVSVVAAVTTETNVSSQEEEEESGQLSPEEEEEEATTKQQTPSKDEKAKEKEICVSGKAQKRVSEGTSEDMNAAATMETNVSSEGEDSGEESSEEVEDEASSEEEATRKHQTPSKDEKAKEKEICASGKAQKRVSEGTSEDMNAAKKVKTEENKMVPQRIWTEEDELVLMQGMIDFESDTGKKTIADKKGFYESIKESITFEVTYSQCISKIASLKKKYKNKAEKGKKPSSSKPLALKAFELSEKIWGNRSGTDAAEDSRKSERIKKLEEEGKDVMNLEQERDWFSNSVLVRWVASLGMDEYSIKRNWSVVAEKKKKKMQERWRLLKAKDEETMLQKTEFLNDLVSLISEASFH